jgi:inorganic pyrophosphatase
MEAGDRPVSKNNLIKIVNKCKVMLDCRIPATGAAQDRKSSSDALFKISGIFYNGGSKEDAMPNFYHLPLGDRAPHELNGVIEIPKGSRNKYEYDAKMGVFRLDRVLSSSMVYAADYGFLPRTLAGDGDPADILVLMEEPTFTGCVIPVRPVGMMKMDDKGEDYKILCVPLHDKRFDEVQRLEDVAPHVLKELEHFFRSYKALDGAFPEISGWHSAKDARDYIIQCVEAFKAASVLEIASGATH